MQETVTFELVRYEVKSRVAEITLNRPPVNAINVQLANEVVAAYRLAKEDSAVRAVILASGLPEVYSAGVDLKLARSFDGQSLRAFIETFYYEQHELLYRMGKPVIAAVTGHARAAGMTWAVSTDIIIAAKEAQFGYPEINVGLLPAMHLVHLARIAGRHRAAQLLFTGEIVSADEMHRLGVFNEVLPREQVLPRARALAAELAEKSPISMKLLRDAFVRANDLDYRRAMESVVETMCSLRDSVDSTEALAAFVEKRAPVFQGR
jgi:enoyl-CoA hydratase/carnithine racemase